MNFLLIPMLIIMTIHFKTSNVKGLAITWGILFFILFMLLSKNIWISILMGANSYVVAWSIFSLANYLEESIFLRLFVLVFGMSALMKPPTFLVDLVLYAYKAVMGD